MAGADLIRTRQGDTLDALCHRYYGSTRGHVEAVLEANPGLAALGPVLPIDTQIRMPAASAAAATPDTTINLWD